MEFFPPVTNTSRIKKVPVRGAISGRRKESTVLNSVFLLEEQGKHKRWQTDDHQRAYVTDETRKDNTTQNMLAPTCVLQNCT
ncbi:hypothetical protein TNCV_1602601 [Trichonephila clavipes]|nr:hypothetical protein TNCV_1602601 [Trichonephila clavipes]